jgi:hypothetical protein
VTTAGILLIIGIIGIIGNWNYSLNVLSMTSRQLREVCEYVVPERGLVVFDWEKDLLTGGWRVISNVSYFFQMEREPLLAPSYFY